MSIDCTDFQIAEPIPFSDEWYCYKFRGPGLRYEVGLCIQTGDIVWINGPFKCGRWPDIKIFRRNLRQLLQPGEQVECDSGHRGEPSCRHCDIIMNITDREAKQLVMARQEDMNADLKLFGCLKQVWRHDRHLHKYVFAAAAVLTQLSYNLQEGPKFQVNY